MHVGVASAEGCVGVLVGECQSGQGQGTARVLGRAPETASAIRARAYREDEEGVTRGGRGQGLRSGRQSLKKRTTM